VVIALEVRPPSVKPIATAWVPKNFNGPINKKKYVLAEDGQFVLNFREAGIDANF